MTAEKLISEYQKKVELCDKALNMLNERKREIRKELWINDDKMQAVLHEAAIHEAQRQAYYQFTKDLEDLL